MTNHCAIKYKRCAGVDKLVLKNLLENKPVLINDFPLRKNYLLEFISKIGTPITDFRNRGKAYFEVKIEGKAGFYSSYANCPYHFPPHTDCSDFENIPNAICLLCVKPDKIGGYSILSDLNSIVQGMKPDLKHFLLEHKFKMREKTRSILYEKSENNFGIIYNRAIIENFSSLNNNEQLQLNRLDALIDNSAFEIKLKKRDLLIIRNDTYLHGRTDFKEPSARLLRRVRFDV